MKMGEFLRVCVCGALLCACVLARAALVWEEGKGWTIQGGIIANVVGENVNVQNALEAMNEGKPAAVAEKMVQGRIKKFFK